MRSRPFALVLALLATLLVPAAAQAAPPANTTLPAITGFPRESQAVSSDTGIWTGTDLVYKRQWLRCNRTGASCSVLSSTAASYTVTAADVASTLRVRVEGRNPEGVAYATSAATDEVTGNPPVITAAPVVSGNLRSGQVLASTPGTWAGTQPLTYGYAWRRCDPVDTTCTTIPGASSASYTLVEADIGFRIRTRVQASNTAGSAEGSSLPTADIGIAQPPATSGAPVLTGIARDGQALRLDYGTWTGASPLKFTQGWWRCDAFGAGCSPISGATGISYSLTPSDVGRKLQAVVVASNPDGSLTRSTALTDAVAINPPASTTAPTATGATRVGLTVTASTGAWSGTPDLDYAYQWLRCDGDGAHCVAIAGATGKTYGLTSAELSGKLVVEVTATNPAGSATRASSATTLVSPAQPPVNTAIPTVTGTGRDGQTLSAGQGTWTGIAAITYTRQWLRCDSLGAGCALIPGATATSYALTPADVDASVRVQVRATNADGTQTAVSDPKTVSAAPPALAGASIPSLGGLPRDESRLTASTGTWTGTPTIVYTYAWERCDATGGNCQGVPGASDATHDVVGDDIGKRLRVKVTGANAGGTFTATSVATSVVEAAAPLATTLPSFTGTARDAQTLTADRGIWSGTATIAYAYQWRRCNLTGAQCVNIAGATSSTYQLQPADVTTTTRIRIEATNRKAMTPTESPASSVVLADRPTATVAPTVNGMVQDGGLLTATTGVWTGTPTIGYTYQWMRCAVPDDCNPIPGATQPTYRLTTADIDSLVRVRVLAANGGGAISVFSDHTNAVSPVIPANLVVPTVTGVPKDGQTLTGSSGAWSGTVPQTKYHQWRRCDAVGDNCVDIADANGLTYGLTPADVGKTVRLYVVSSNGAGATDVLSERSPVITAIAPVPTVAAAITGEPKDGRTLSVALGVWTGTPTITYAYQWQRCTGPTAQLRCTNIDGATTQSYTLRTADVDQRIQAVLVASNAGGSITSVLPFTGLVAPNPPVNSQIPVVSGVVRDGEELQVSDGLWTGVITFAYDYQWYRCDVDGANCGRVSGATSSRFALTPTDVGLTLKAEVIARNAGGSTSAYSEATTVGVPRPPGSIAAPKVTGHTGLGETMTVDDGGWIGSPPLVFTRAWLRCDTAGDGCVAIGATGRVYQVTADDLGHRIRVEVTAANVAAAVSATSDATRVVSTDFPVNTTPPSVITDSVVAVDVPLTALVGEWAGAGPFETAYRWSRCDSTGRVCADIAGATDRIYVPTADDLGKMLRVSVTRDNGTGAATATSPAVGLVKLAPPSLAIAPAIKASGALLAGNDMSATKGTWTGGPPITYGYQWLRCGANGAGCEPINGAGETKYTLTDADVGRTVRVRVSASNATLTVPADSEPSATIGALAPESKKKPTLTVDGGTGSKARVGALVRGDGGLWAGTEAIAYAYRWQRCASTTDCSDIPGAEGNAYTLTDADAGQRVRFLVTARNVAATVDAASANSDIVAGTPPTAVSKPTVEIEGGAPRDGAAFTAQAGGWAGTGPVALTYQWQRCPATGAGACKAIAKATETSYVAATGDVGSRLSVLISAKSSAGKADAQSAPTDPVAAVAPAGGDRPVITRSPGKLVPGSKLTGSAGKWGGTTPMTFAYQWLRCDRKGRNCRAIDSATKPIYDMLPADFTDAAMSVSLRVAVTATNAAGKVTATSVQFGGKAAAGSGEGDTGGASTPAGRAAAAANAAIAAKSIAALSRKAAKIDSKGRLLVSMTCKRGKAACTGALKVTAPGYAKTLRFKQVKAGKSRRWRLKLKRPTQKAAGKAKGLPTTLTMSVKGEQSWTKRVKVKAPKKIVKRWKRLR